MRYCYHQDVLFKQNVTCTDSGVIVVKYPSLTRKNRKHSLHSKDRSYSRGSLNNQQECKGMQRHNQHFIHIRLLSCDNKPHNVERPLTLHI